MTGGELSLWGLPLDEARERARAAGREVECVLTRPPWQGRAGGRAMVVGQRTAAPGRLLLIYAHEEYRRETQQGG